MYQFSLEFYITLFKNSIKKSNTAENLHDRIKNLNEHHTYKVYEIVCRGLLERHKLIFAFLICIQILIEDDKINIDEFNFLLNCEIDPKIKYRITSQFPGKYKNYLYYLIFKEKL